jgi:hypothetical protein
MKLSLYFTLIRPIVTYGAETWAATENELQKLFIFERKVLRKIYSPDKDQDQNKLRIRFFDWRSEYCTLC